MHEAGSLFCLGSLCHTYTHTHTHTYVATCILYECTHIWKGWPHLSICNNFFPLEMKKKLTCRSNTANGLFPFLLKLN